MFNFHYCFLGFPHWLPILDASSSCRLGMEIDDIAQRKSLGRTCGILCWCWIVGSCVLWFLLRWAHLVDGTEVGIVGSDVLHVWAWFDLAYKKWWFRRCWWTMELLFDDVMLMIVRRYNSNGLSLYSSWQKTSNGHEIELGGLRQIRHCTMTNGKPKLGKLDKNFQDGDGKVSNHAAHQAPWQGLKALESGGIESKPLAQPNQGLSPGAV